MRDGSLETGDGVREGGVEGCKKIRSEAPMKGYNSHRKKQLGRDITQN